MSLTNLALKNKVSTYLIILLICFFGIIAYLSLEKAEDPGYTIKTAVIVTNWPGATAEEVGNLVSKKIENEVRNMDSLDYVESKNLPGQSNVYVNLKQKYWNPDKEWTELRNKITTFVTPQLPYGVEPPLINTYFGDVYGTVLSVSSTDLSYEELYKQGKKLEEALLFNVPEIGKIEFFGIQKNIIYINLNNEKIAEMGITLQEISSSIKGGNIIISGGNLNTKSYKVLINPSGTLKTLEDIRKIVVSGNKRGERIYLGEIATVEKGYINPPSLLTFNKNTKSIVLAIALSNGENILKLKSETKKVIKNFSKTLPLSTNISFVYNEGDFVENKIGSFLSSLAQAIISIVAIMLIFLGLKTGLIVASLTPVSIAATLIGLKFFGYGINQITLAGLIIALGMLVDSAVVMSENIIVLSQQGMDKKEACLESGKSLAIPLFTGSLATCVAMLPIIGNRASMGQYVGPMAIVVFIALGSSWIINQTFIPLISFDYLNPQSTKITDYNKDKLYVGYRKILIYMLKNIKKSVFLIIGSLVLSIFLFKNIPSEFMPASDTPVMSSYINLPKGSSINTTNAIVSDLNQYINKTLYVGNLKPLPTTILDFLLTGGTSKVYEKNGILDWNSYIGAGGPRYTLSYSPEAPQSEFAYVLFSVTDYSLIPKYSSAIDTYIKNKYPNVTIITRALGTGTSAEFDLSYQLISANQLTLNKATTELETYLRGLKEIDIVNNNWGNSAPEISIEIDYNKANLAGLTSQEIADAIQFSLQGFNSTFFYDFKAPPLNTVIPIKIRGTTDYKNQLSSLKSIKINNSKGYSVPLEQVATLKLQYIPTFVYKRDSITTMQVQATILEGYSATDINSTVEKWIKEKFSNDWKEKELSFKLSGTMQTSQENSQGLVNGIPIALLLMTIIVTLQFNSIKKGLIIMTSIPLALLGCSIGLIITRLNFGFMAIVGIISLAGVVLNHTIVLIDKITIEEEVIKRDLCDALIIGCQTRLRPILLTVFTTLAGLLPLYFFGGPLFSQLSAVMIFGLAFDIFLCLGFIPVIYSIVYNIRFKDYEYIDDNVPKPIENNLPN